MRNGRSLATAIVVFYVMCIFIVFFSAYFEGDDSSNSDDDYARITDVEYQAIVLDEQNAGGKIFITERLTFDIHAASEDNLFWELWRDLPETYQDGLKIDYDVYSVKQINEDGTETVYTESPKLYWYDDDYTSSTYGPGKWYHSEGPYDGEYNFECVLFYVDGLYREEVVFEIQYVMNNASFRYGDVSELYVSMFSGEDIEHLESFKAEILIPDKDMPNDDNYEFHTYGTNEHEFYYSESDTMNPGYHTFYINLDEDELEFKPYNNYLEFTLWAFDEDKHKFTDYAPHNNYYNADVLDELRDGYEEYTTLPERYEEYKQKALEISIIAVIIIALFIYIKDRSVRKKYKFYKPENQIIYYRDIPSDLDPYFVANFVHSKKKKMPKDLDNNGYSAILLNLVRKQYIELVKVNTTKDWTNDNTKIILKYRGAKDTVPVENKTNISNNNTIISSTNNTPRPVFSTIAGSPYNSTKFEYISGSSNKVDTRVKDNNIVQYELKSDLYNIDNKKLEPLSLTEKAYFNLISRHTINYEVTMAELQRKIERDYNNTDTFVRTVDNSFKRIGYESQYFQKSEYRSVIEDLTNNANGIFLFGLLVMVFGNILSSSTRLELANGAFFVFGIGTIILSIILKQRAQKYVLFTQLGENEYAKWKGLYDFLNSSTLMNERTVVELPLWEKYLVYATAMGISEKVIKALEIRCPDLSASSSPVLSNRYYRSSSFRSSSRSFSTATRSASVSSHSFSGGSYGGGGRGGGGGGGGH